MTLYRRAGVSIDAQALRFSVLACNVALLRQKHQECALKKPKKPQQRAPENVVINQELVEKLLQQHVVTSRGPGIRQHGIPPEKVAQLAEYLSLERMLCTHWRNIHKEKEVHVKVFQNISKQLKRSSDIIAACIKADRSISFKVLRQAFDERDKRAAEAQSDNDPDASSALLVSKINDLSTLESTLSSLNVISGHIDEVAIKLSTMTWSQKIFETYPARSWRDVAPRTAYKLAVELKLNRNKSAVSLKSKNGPIPRFVSAVMILITGDELKVDNVGACIMEAFSNIDSAVT